MTNRSAPIHRLKREARLLARRDGIPLHEALDRVAAREGRRSWSHLMQSLPASVPASAIASLPAAELFRRLDPGDLVLLAARPAQGKTLLGLRLLLEALEAGRDGMFFTLEYTQREVVERLRGLGLDPDRSRGRLAVDASDAICAPYIVDAMRTAPRGTLAVVDYLQLLDRSRATSPLAEQVRVLGAFARDRGLTLVFLSQVDRSYDPARNPVPDIGHVRLANPVDLSLFSKTCFLNAGEMRFAAGQGWPR